MAVGCEWLIDAHGCRRERLRDRALLERICEEVLRELSLAVVGRGQWHGFPFPGGVTGLYLLSESHLACHTWPEHGLAAFSLFSCREASRWCWESRLKELLEAERVEVRRVLRGGTASGKPAAAGTLVCQKPGFSQVAGLPSPVPISAAEQFESLPARKEEA